MKFRIVLEFDPEVQSYSAVCPELPGCASAGETEEEVMADLYLIRLDIPLISRHLTAVGDPMDVEAVRQWLLESGLQPRGEWWLCEEIDLGLFGEGEILQAMEDRK